MGLRIANIQLSRFRNHHAFALNDVGPLTILVGSNGVGKTNILEAINLVTSGESFRNAQIAQLIKENECDSRIVMDATDGNRRLQTALYMEPGKKRYKVNGKSRAIADLKGLLPAVAFTPDDLQLAKKSSSVKRAALDELGSQLSKSYYIVSRDYEKALRYKNRLLKEEANNALIESINSTLAMCASQLFCYRMVLFQRIAPVLENNYREISLSREQLNMTYTPSWDYLATKQGNCHPQEWQLGENGGPRRDQISDILVTSFDSFGEEERARKRALVGPHNDKIEITLSQKEASAYASQGQQRSIVLAWKLAEVQLIQQSLETYPVLLLDDVMSELDSMRRDMLVNFVKDEIQTFITATDLSGFSAKLIDKAQVVTV